MPLPLLAAGLIAGSGAVSGVYNVKKALESRKYWDDYYRNTGYRPRYPLRSGFYDIVPALASGVSSFGGAYGVYHMIKPKPVAFNSHNFGRHVENNRYYGHNYR